MTHLGDQLRGLLYPVAMVLVIAALWIHAWSRSIADADPVGFPADSRSYTSDAADFTLDAVEDSPGDPNLLDDTLVADSIDSMRPAVETH